MKTLFLLISVLLTNTAIAVSDMEDEASTRAFLACGGFPGWLLSAESNGQKVIYLYECAGSKSIVKIECGSSKFSCRQLRYEDY